MDSWEFATFLVLHGSKQYLSVGWKKKTDKFWRHGENEMFNRTRGYQMNQETGRLFDNETKSLAAAFEVLRRSRLLKSVIT